MSFYGEDMKRDDVELMTEIVEEEDAKRDDPEYQREAAIETDDAFDGGDEDA